MALLPHFPICGTLKPCDDPANIIKRASFNICNKYTKIGVKSQSINFAIIINLPFSITSVQVESVIILS